MEASEEPLEQKLSVSAAKEMEIERIRMNEPIFRWMLNEDQMGTDKLSDGIRKFAKDIIKLEEKIIILIQNYKEN